MRNMLRSFIRFSSILLLLVVQGFTLAQAPTETPVRIVIPTNTSPPKELVISTLVPTGTPRPEGPVVAEIKEEFSAQRIYPNPDLEAEPIGQMTLGEQYPVIGRYFRWVEVVYDTQRNSSGWIYDEYVTFFGDPSTIPTVLDPYSQPTAIPTTIAEATESAGRIIEISTSDANENPNPESIDPENLVLGVLPTYTYPAVIAQRPTRESSIDITLTPTPSTFPEVIEGIIQTGVPPIIPVAVLGSLGLLGLLVSFWRR